MRAVQSAGWGPESEGAGANQLVKGWRHTPGIFRVAGPNARPVQPPSLPRTQPGTVTPWRPRLQQVGTQQQEELLGNIRAEEAGLATAGDADQDAGVAGRLGQARQAAGGRAALGSWLTIIPAVPVSPCRPRTAPDGVHKVPAEALRLRGHHRSAQHRAPARRPTGRWRESSQSSAQLAACPWPPWPAAPGQRGAGQPPLEMTRWSGGAWEQQGLCGDLAGGRAAASRGSYLVRRAGGEGLRWALSATSAPTAPQAQLKCGRPSALRAGSHLQPASYLHHTAGQA